MFFCLLSRHTNEWSGLSEAACAYWRSNLNSPGPGFLRTSPPGRMFCLTVSEGRMEAWMLGPGQVFQDVGLLQVIEPGANHI